MHDEVSETEHIRANLAIERSIAEGCDVLLDVNQVLCRQGKVQRSHQPVAFESRAVLRITEVLEGEGGYAHVCLLRMTYPSLI